MAKHWNTYEHPSDLGLEARADSLEGLLEALAEGLGRQLCQAGQVRAQRQVELNVESDDVPDLAVDFLSQVLRRFDLERFLTASAKVELTGESSLRAVLSGETYDPARHELGPEIKAVTYHQLVVERRDGQWLGRVLLDL
jgi:SHS2 domain-containing protein